MSLSNASIVRLSHSTPLKAARTYINRQHILQRAIDIQQIPAPTFHEGERAAKLVADFQALGLQDIRQDALHNVYGWLPGDSPEAPVLLISAHTDTVFPHGTDLRIRQEGERIYGPGLGDNSLGVAALLGLAEVFASTNIPRAARICFLANSREEGLGDLGGMHAALDALGDEVKAGIVLEGMALGRVYNAGIAVRRLKVSVEAPGGHSWLHFGQASAIHTLMRFGERLTQLPVSNDPRTTFNIGLIEGGTSINTIAPQAACYIDLRSVDSDTLNDLESQVRKLAAQEAADDPSVTVVIERVGDRPAGQIAADHPLVRLALDAHQSIGMVAEVEGGSTDANALLARGTPAVCVGVSYGGNAHIASEYIETAPIQAGMWQLVLLAAAAANGLPAWQ